MVLVFYLGYFCNACVHSLVELDADRDRFATLGATIVASSMAFIPVIDGDLIPVHPLAAITAGTGSGLPLLTGTTTEEYRLFLFPTGLAAHITEQGLADILALLGVGPVAAGLYRANRPGASPGDVFAAVITDRFFRLPALAVAEARAGGGKPA